jgi:hypothetical protein
MTRILDARERKTLEKISFDDQNFHVKGELVDIGTIHSALSSDCRPRFNKNRYNDLFKTLTIEATRHDI